MLREKADLSYKGRWEISWMTPTAKGEVHKVRTPKNQNERKGHGKPAS